MTYATHPRTRSARTSGSTARPRSASAARPCVKKHDAIAFDNLFAGDQPSIGAAAYIVAPITCLLGNDYEKVDIEGARPDDHVDRGAEDGDARARLARRPASARRPHGAAEGAAPHVSRRRSRCARCRSRFRPTRRGTLSLLVADGSRLSQIEQREARAAAAAQRRRR